MLDFQQQVITLAQQQNNVGWMNPAREQGISRWQQAEWPTRKTEAWKYTSLKKLAGKAVVTTALESSGAQSDELWLPLDAHRAVFVDGVFNAAASQNVADWMVSFEDADAKQSDVIKALLGRLADSKVHMFSALNEALINNGLLLQIPDNTQLSKPLYVIHVSSNKDAAIASQRLLVSVGKNSEAEIIVHYLTSDDAQCGFVNAYSEIFLADNAKLKHYRLNMESENISHVGGVFVELQAHAEFRGFAIAKGSELMRVDYQIFHRGSGAHVDLQGVYLPRNSQRVDYHTAIDHCVPHCTSNEVFRGIIGDDARAVFNGRIHIHADAQKTFAEMSNKNLLTSNRAEIDTKPELEIYADDVKCAHGATVSQINDETLFYLQSRGLSKQAAKTMLSFGFINELLRDISNEVVADYLTAELSKQFGREESFSNLAGDVFE